MGHDKTTRGRRGMGTLCKRIDGKFYPASHRGKGIFYLFYSDGDGRRVKLRLVKNGEPVTDLATARAEQSRLRMASVTGDRIEILKRNIAEVRELEERMAIEEAAAEPPLRIDDAWGKWRDLSERETGEGTLCHYRGAWRKFCAWCGAVGISTVREVTAERARQYIQAMRNAKWRPNTINHHLVFLRGLFGALQEAAGMAANPFGAIRKLRPDVVSRRVLTVEELRAILENTSGELHTLFLLGMCTGMRLGDCAMLQWHEADLVRGIIRHKPFKTLHSSGAVAIVGIPAALHAELSALPRTSEYIMPGIAARYSGSGMTGLSKQIRDTLQRCGIETTATNADGRRITLAGFHSLRHTWVTMQAMAGTPQAVIQAGAGHSNPAMTEHYTHISEDAARRAAGNLHLPIATEAAREDAGALRQAVIDAAQNADADTLRRMLAAATTP